MASIATDTGQHSQRQTVLTCPGTSPYTASMGSTAGPYTPILNRLTQRNVIAGAVEMELPSMYPAAPATIQPTTRPTMIEMFLRKGDPKSSVKRMEKNERKPRPMNSGEPHLPKSTLELDVTGRSVSPYIVSILRFEYSALNKAAITAASRPSLRPMSHYLINSQFNV